MATYSIQTSAITGTVLTMGAVTVSDDFPNDGKTFLIVNNASAGSVSVTINSVTQCDQGFDHDLVVAVAAGVEKMIGPFAVARFGASVGVTYDSAASVTAAAVRHTA
jgi:hypothetical protein